MVLGFPTVKCISNRNIKEIKEVLTEKQFKLYEINGETIIDDKTFFKVVSETLPLNPKLSGKVNYDAFVDSFWEGLVDQGDEEVAVIWYEAQNMIEHGVGDLLKISECFHDLAHSLLKENGQDKSISLFVFLVGKGRNFDTTS